MFVEELNVGDKVKLSADAVYFTGQQISPLVKNLIWEISSMSGNRVMLGKSADGHYSLNAPVDIKYLIKTVD